MDRLNNAYNPKLNTILVTGANGFVGKPLCLALFAQGQAEITGVRVKLNNYSLSEIRLPTKDRA